MTTFAANLGFPEAPVLLPDDSFLCVEMTPDTGCVTHISKNGSDRKVLATTGRPNGLARDRHGAIWIAETAQRAVLRMSMDGSYSTFAKASRGEPFLFLNDLAFAPNGDLFVTDSGIPIDDIVPGGVLVPNYRELPFDGRIYRVDVHTGEVETVDRGFHFSNGVVFGPDAALYVNETLSGNIYRYDWNNGRVTGRRELFGNVIEHFDPAILQGPDGMKFGADGNLYAAVYGQGDVTVLGKRGEVVKRIKTEGGHPTNLCFGRAGTRRMYVTEVSTGSMQVFDVGTDGYMLHG